MKQKSHKGLLFSMMSFTFAFAFLMLGLNSCGNASKGDQQEAKIDDDAFYATQPVRSGLYDADYYDITGTNARKGRFDGRIYFTLSPEMSAFYVFENGNRTKIDYLVALQKPFEKGDSGIYYSVDTKNHPVTINTDSTMYILGFQRGAEDMKITFSPKPRHTGSAIEILEKINAQKTKK